MTEQSEALRLADAIDPAATWSVAPFCREAAAELRRLQAENAMLHQRHYDDNVEYTRVLAQRDALLEALCELLADAEFLGWDTAKARAAIKAVEE